MGGRELNNNIHFFQICGFCASKSCSARFLAQKGYPRLVLAYPPPPSLGPSFWALVALLALLAVLVCSQCWQCWQCWHWWRCWQCRQCCLCKRFCGSGTFFGFAAHSCCLSAKGCHMLIFNCSNVHVSCFFRLRIKLHI